MKSQPHSFEAAEDVRKRQLRWLTIPALFLLATSCAFDLVQVKQKPVTLTATSDVSSFLLARKVKAHLSTGFPTVLKANTTWNLAGLIEFGKVYVTKDQIAQVEASNVHEPRTCCATFPKLISG